MLCLDFVTHTLVVLLAKYIVFVPGKRVEEIVFRNPKQFDELLVVFGHELRFWGSKVGIALSTMVRDLQNVVNVFNRSEPFCVQLKAASGF